MTRTRFLLPLFGLALALASCNGPKALSKRAAELHGAGFNQQASDLYTMALHKRPGYVDAMLGLKMTGQGVVDAHIGEFQRAAMDGRRSDAIAEYDEMMAFRKRVSSVGVELVVPASVEADHEDLVDEHLIELDALGHAQLEEEAFGEAEATFREILRLDTQYGDAAELLIIAQAEPKYRSGKSAFEANRFREAHGEMKLVLALDAEYKDAKQLQDEALEMGRFNVAIANFDSRDRDRDVALELRSGIQRELLNSTDPFVGVVDRTLREDIIAEQELSLSGISDESVEVGELAGARAILSGSILTYSVETGSLMSTERSGFRKYFREVKDEEGNIKKVAAFAPARYTLHTQRRHVLLKFEIKLISTETGEVLLSEVEQVHAQDAVEYAVSQVPGGNLYPARPNGEVNRSGKSRLNALLGARRQLATAASLRAQVIREATARGERDIDQFLNRHIE